MKKGAIFWGLLGFLLAGLALAPGAEKLKYGTSVRVEPAFYLPVLAAADQGIWKKNGLEVEWVPFRSGSDHYRAFAAGSVAVGSTMVPAEIQAAARGIPVVMVCDLKSYDDFSFWVRSDGRIKAPQEVKGARIGVSRFGGTEYAYGRMVAKALKLEKDVKILSMGGIAESTAGLKTGAIDVMVQPVNVMINLKLSGVVRQLFMVDEYRPKPWAAYIVAARRDLTENNPETVRRVVSSIIQAMNFIEMDRGWTIAKMKELSGFSQEAAEAIYPILNFSKDGRIDRKGVENVRDFLIEYGIVKKEEAPPIDKIYTDKFVR